MPFSMDSPPKPPVAREKTDISYKSTVELPDNFKHFPSSKQAEIINGFNLWAKMEDGGEGFYELLDLFYVGSYYFWGEDNTKKGSITWKKAYDIRMMQGKFENFIDNAWYNNFSSFPFLKGTKIKLTLSLDLKDTITTKKKIKMAKESVKETVEDHEKTAKKAIKSAKEAVDSVGTNLTGFWDSAKWYLIGGSVLLGLLVIIYIIRSVEDITD